MSQNRAAVQTAAWGVQTPNQNPDRPALSRDCPMGALLLPMTRAAGVELEIGARFPADPNEKIVVKNDGGVRNESTSFALGLLFQRLPEGMVCRDENCWWSGFGRVRMHPDGRFWWCVSQWDRDEHASGSGAVKAALSAIVLLSRIQNNADSRLGPDRRSISLQQMSIRWIRRVANFKLVTLSRFFLGQWLLANLGVVLLPGKL
jgi:hypothetical protein